MVEITLIGGLVGGLIATVVMTVFMMGLGDDSPPPTALFWSKYVGGGDPEEYMLPGMVLHMFYGVVAGVVFAGVLPAVGFGDVALATALGLGLAYGVVLFVGAAAFWMNVVLALEPERKAVGAFLFFHLVYGVVLGAVLGAGVV
jgi:hypothetical protein